MQTLSTSNHIASTPDVCGGRPRVTGTGVRVQDIACDYELHGLASEEIARGYDGVSLAQVHAALAYYYDHRQEIQRDIRTDRELLQRLGDRQRTQSAGGTDANPAA